MQVFVNGESLDILGDNLSEEIHKIKINTKGIAVAVNETVVPASLWGETKLKENDKILIITATQGG